MKKLFKTIAIAALAAVCVGCVAAFAACGGDDSGTTGGNDDEQQQTGGTDDGQQTGGSTTGDNTNSGTTEATVLFTLSAPEDDDWCWLDCYSDGTYIWSGDIGQIITESGTWTWINRVFTLIQGNGNEIEGTFPDGMTLTVEYVGVMSDQIQVTLTSSAANWGLAIGQMDTYTPDASSSSSSGNTSDEYNTGAYVNDSYVAWTVSGDPLLSVDNDKTKTTGYMDPGYGLYFYGTAGVGGQFGLGMSTEYLSDYGDSVDMGTDATYVFIYGDWSVVNGDIVFSAAVESAFKDGSITGVTDLTIYFNFTSVLQFGPAVTLTSDNIATLNGSSSNESATIKLALAVATATDDSTLYFFSDGNAALVSGETTSTGTWTADGSGDGAVTVKLGSDTTGITSDSDYSLTISSQTYTLDSDTVWDLVDAYDALNK